MWSGIRWLCCLCLCRRIRRRFCMRFWFFWGSIWQGFLLVFFVFIIRIRSRRRLWERWSIFLRDGRFMRLWSIRIFPILWFICHWFWWGLIRFIRGRSHGCLSGRLRFRLCRISISFIWSVFLCLFMRLSGILGFSVREVWRMFWDGWWSLSAIMWWLWWSRRLFLFRWSWRFLVRIGFRLRIMCLFYMIKFIMRSIWVIWSGRIWSSGGLPGILLLLWQVCLCFFPGRRSTWIWN